MKIETKFNIGDEFWTMKDDKPRQLYVEDIRTYCKYEDLERNKIGITIYYNARIYNGSTSYVCFTEDKVFSSKEELLKSL
jgi:hypothetical protein